MPVTADQTRTRPVHERRTEQPRLWNVVILDDDDHSYEYVIEMLVSLFGHSVERAFEIAEKIDAEGRGVCKTTHRELAELKREQIISFGPDARIAACSGPMSVILEPADFGDDDADNDN